MAVASLLPSNRGYVDPSLAAELPRLSHGAATDAMVVDGRVVLAQTAQDIRRRLGETPVNVWLALNAVWVENGFGVNGRGTETYYQLARKIWPRAAQKGNGGKANRMLDEALQQLYHYSATAQDYNSVTGELQNGKLSQTRLLQDLVIDQRVRSSRGAVDPASRAAAGRATGGAKGATVSWRFASTYIEHAHTEGLMMLDFDVLSSLRNVAKTLWIQLAAPRFDFQRVPGDPRLECVEMSLTSGHLRNLGITSPEPKQQDKTLRSAVQRVTQADPAYAGVEIDRGAGVFRVIRSAGYVVPLVGTPGVRPAAARPSTPVLGVQGGPLGASTLTLFDANQAAA